MLNYFKGNGGHGGNGGTIVVEIQHQDMDTLMVLKNYPKYNGGKGGIGGQGGKFFIIFCAFWKIILISV